MKQSVFAISLVSLAALSSLGCGSTCRTPLRAQFDDLAAASPPTISPEQPGATFTAHPGGSGTAALTPGTDKMASYACQGGAIQALEYAHAGDVGDSVYIIWNGVAESFSGTQMLISLRDEDGNFLADIALDGQSNDVAIRNVTRDNDGNPALTGEHLAGLPRLVPGRSHVILFTYASGRLQLTVGARSTSRVDVALRAERKPKRVVFEHLGCGGSASAYLFDNLSMTSCCPEETAGSMCSL